MHTTCLVRESFEPVLLANIQLEPFTKAEPLRKHPKKQAEQPGREGRSEHPGSAISPWLEALA